MMKIGIIKIFAIAALIAFSHVNSFAGNTSTPFVALEDNIISFESENITVDAGNIKKRIMSGVNPSTIFSSSSLPTIHMTLSPIKSADRMAIVKLSFRITSASKKTLSVTVKNIKIKIRNGETHISVPKDKGKARSANYSYKQSGFTLNGEIRNNSSGPVLSEEPGKISFSLEDFKAKIAKALNTSPPEFSGTYSYSVTVEGTNIGIEENGKYKPAKTFKGTISFN